MGTEISEQNKKLFQTWPVIKLRIFFIHNCTWIINTSTYVLIMLHIKKKLFYGIFCFTIGVTINVMFQQCN